MKLTSKLTSAKAFKTSALVATMAGALLAALPAQATTLKISHVRPQETVVDKDIKQLNEDLKAATEGDLKLRIYAANALGDYTLVQERISVGAVDMALQPASTSVDRRMQISTLPFLASDWQQAQAIYGPNAPIRVAMEELFAEQDITLLAAYPVYFGGVSLNRDAVAAGDPNTDKGIKLRVPPIKSFQLLADNLGYIGSPLPFSDAFTAVQTGVVDGVIGSGAEGYYASFRDVTKTYIPLNTHFEVWYLLINSERFEDLDDAERNALKAMAQKFEMKRWEVAQADQKANEMKLVETGATIVELTPEELNNMASKVRASVWPQIVNDIGADWSQPLLDKALN